MKKKIIGIFVCILLIITALSAIGGKDVQTTRLVNENNYSQSYQNTQANSLDIITINIIAKVVNVLDSDNLLNGAIKVNDTIKGKYTYSSGTPDIDPDPKYGLYWYNLPPYGIEVKAGRFVFKTNPSDVRFLIYIENDIEEPYLSGDVYMLLSDKNLNLKNGLIVNEILWMLFDDSGTALSNGSLPTTAPDLSKWKQSPNYGLIIEGKDPSNPYHYYIQSEVTKATKSKARDVYFTIQPILLWLFERFPNIFPILRHLMKL